jgi:hypothetical protein
MKPGICIVWCLNRLDTSILEVDHRAIEIFLRSIRSMPHCLFDLASRRNKFNSDDDDFLQFTTAKDDRWNVIQADQVISKLISLYDWSGRVDGLETTSVIKSPAICSSTANNCGIDINRLTKVWSSIHDTVEIVRVRTLTNRWGKTTYQFRIRNQRFPN